MEYVMRDEIINNIKKYGAVRILARKTGLTEGYVSQIINKRKTKISKLTAYAVSKAISSEYEIKDVFIQI